jgi:hypothetical protein
MIPVPVVLAQQLLMHLHVQQSDAALSGAAEPSLKLRSSPIAAAGHLELAGGADDWQPKVSQSPEGGA